MAISSLLGSAAVEMMKCDCGGTSIASMLGSAAVEVHPSEEETPSEEEMATTQQQRAGRKLVSIICEHPLIACMHAIVAIY